MDTSLPGGPLGQQTMPSHSGEQKPSGETRATLTLGTRDVPLPYGGFHDLLARKHLPFATNFTCVYSASHGNRRCGAKLEIISTCMTVKGTTFATVKANKRPLWRIMSCAAAM